MIDTVSVIVITYNAVDDLKECLASLQSQDYNDLEIIVVNDASTDSTKEYLAEYVSNQKNDFIIINS